MNPSSPMLILLIMANFHCILGVLSWVNTTSPTFTYACWSLLFNETHVMQSNTASSIYSKSVRVVKPRPSLFSSSLCLIEYGHPVRHLGNWCGKETIGLLCSKWAGVTISLASDDTYVSSLLSSTASTLVVMVWRLPRVVWVRHSTFFSADLVSPMSCSQNAPNHGVHLGIKCHSTPRLARSSASIAYVNNYCSSSTTAW